MRRRLLGGGVILLMLFNAPLAGQEPNWILKSPANSMARSLQ
jgi:hypothetical protein